MERTELERVINDWLVLQAQVEQCDREELLRRMAIGELVAGNSVLDLVEQLIEKGFKPLTVATLADWVDSTDMESIHSSLWSLVDHYNMAEHDRNRLVIG